MELLSNIAIRIVETYHITCPDPKHRKHWKNLLELKGAFQGNLGFPDSTKAN
jgi:hypothetical protein